MPSPAGRQVRTLHKLCLQPAVHSAKDITMSGPLQALQPGLLWVAEQIPGLVAAADMTSHLERGYWPSYNVPFFPEVRPAQVCGIPTGPCRTVVSLALHCCNSAPVDASIQFSFVHQSVFLSICEHTFLADVAAYLCCRLWQAAAGRM